MHPEQYGLSTSYIESVMSTVILEPIWLDMCDQFHLPFRWLRQPTDQPTMHTYFNYNLMNETTIRDRSLRNTALPRRARSPPLSVQVVNNAEEPLFRRPSIRQDKTSIVIVPIHEQRLCLTEVMPICLGWMKDDNDEDDDDEGDIVYERPRPPPHLVHE